MANEKAKPRFQFSLRTLLVAVVAFALGFGARNVASGLHPLTMRLLLPTSKTLIHPGDALIVESLTDPQFDSKINRRVTVLADGTIILPYIGTVSVSGLDLAALEKSLIKSYGRFFKSPTIQVYRANASEPLYVVTSN